MSSVVTVHLTEKSTNKKTGPIPVSTTSENTCPTVCPLRGRGCYAKTGPLALHWNKVSSGQRGMSWNQFCDKVSRFPAGTLWRHNQAGDLPGNGRNDIHSGMLQRLVVSNRPCNGFTYTHKPLTDRNVKLIRWSNSNGFTINISANSLAHLDSILKFGLPCTTLLPRDVVTGPVFTPQGNPVIVCPAITNPNVSCLDCRLCSIAGRNASVGFPVHGTQYRAADTIARKAT